MVLALEFRPQTFEDLVGQKHIKPILKAMVAKNELPPALLFSGSRGTGKTSCARILAAALNCESEDARPCSKCPSCKSIARGNSLDVIEVDAASNGLVADIRKIKDAVLYAHGGRWRVVLLDEAHSMSKEAFNALLKVLEEPPPTTVFILLTTEPNKILDTVLSRTMAFEYRRLTTADIVGRLMFIAEQKDISADEDMLLEIASRSQGGMRDAVMLLDQVSRVEVSTLKGFKELFGIRDTSIDIFESALTGNHKVGVALIEEHFFTSGDASALVSDMVMLVRDLLVLKSGGLLTAYAEADVKIRADLATKVSVDRLVSVIKVLWDLKNRVRAVDNDQRAALHMAYVLLSEAVCPTVPTQSTVNSAVAPKMTLEQMRSMGSA